MLRPRVTRRGEGGGSWCCCWLHPTRHSKEEGEHHEMKGAERGKASPAEVTHAVAVSCKGAVPLVQWWPR